MGGAVSEQYNTSDIDIFIYGIEDENAANEKVLH